MRLSCAQVPRDFLFVDVTGHPTLHVAPTGSRMRVYGVVADIVRSEYVFNVLVVGADRIVMVDR